MPDISLRAVGLKWALRIQRDVKLGGELGGVEGAAGEVAASNVERGDSAFAVVGLDYDIFAGGILLNIYFTELHASLFQEGFGATAIGAPSGAVDSDGVHGGL
jgi:hypothetical protein